MTKELESLILRHNGLSINGYGVIGLILLFALQEFERGMRTQAHGQWRARLEKCDKRKKPIN